MPSAFTLGNLFFGFWAIVYAFNGQLSLGGLVHHLRRHPRHAGRAGGTALQHGHQVRRRARFARRRDLLRRGAGAAPLLPGILEAGRFAWLLCYIYVVAVALRLARYNVAAASKPHSRWFTGMPSPSAGMTLAAYYPFSQTAGTAVAGVPRSAAPGARGAQLLLAVLMVSNVKYPQFPPSGSARSGHFRPAGAPRHSARRHPRARVFSLSARPGVHHLRPGPDRRARPDAAGRWRSRGGRTPGGCHRLRISRLPFSNGAAPA